MRAFIVFSCLALAAAKPQYSYSQPSSLLGSSSNQNQGFIAPAPLQQAPSFQAAPSFLPAPSFAPAPNYQPAPITSSTVQKHIYVHVPPQEQEEPFVPPAPVVNHQKHYKIIFIKAPSPPQQVFHAQPAQSISEEKTLVYVLVKKPEAPEIRFAQPQPVTPSKPEVYFIRYKTEKDRGVPLQTSVAPGPLASSESGPSPAAIALPSPSTSISLPSSGPSPSASDSSLLSLGSSQAASVIQPRNPSPVYGPAN